MNKPIVIAVLGLGAYLLWKKSQGPVAGLGESPYSDLSGLGKFSVKRALSSAATVAQAPMKVAATPFRVMAAPATAAFGAGQTIARGGSIAQAGRVAASTAKHEMMTPLTVPVRSLQPVMTKAMSQKVSNFGSKPGIRVALGRPKPGTNAPTAIVSGATMGPTVADSATWSPVSGQSGWEYSIASDGSTVFRNLGAGQSFYCTSSDMSQIGTLDGAVNMFLYGNPYGPGGGQQSGSVPGTVTPDTSSMPGTQGSTFVPDTSSQSYSAGQDTSAGQSFTQDPSLVSDPGAAAPSDPASDPSQVMQQYQPANTVAPAAATKMNPLVVAGTLIAVPLAFMLTGKK